MSKLRQLIEAANRKCEMAWKVYSYNPEKDNELVDTSKAFDCIAAAQAHKRDILEKNPNYTVEIVAESMQKNESIEEQQDAIAKKIADAISAKFGWVLSKEGPYEEYYIGKGINPINVKIKNDKDLQVQLRANEQPKTFKSIKDAIDFIKNNMNAYGFPGGSAFYGKLQSKVNKNIERQKARDTYLHDISDSCQKNEDFYKYIDDVPTREIAKALKELGIKEPYATQKAKIANLLAKRFGLRNVPTPIEMTSVLDALPYFAEESAQKNGDDLRKKLTKWGLTYGNPDAPTEKIVDKLVKDFPELAKYKKEIIDKVNAHKKKHYADYDDVAFEILTRSESSQKNEATFKPGDKVSVKSYYKDGNQFITLRNATIIKEITEKEAGQLDPAYNWKEPTGMKYYLVKLDTGYKKAVLASDLALESAQKSESKVNMSKLKNEIQAAVNKYFKDDKDLLEYVYIDTKKDKLGRDILEVRAELGYNDMVKLADHLDKIVTKYDRYAYFDQETSGIMTAVFESAQKNEAKHSKYFNRNIYTTLEKVSKSILNVTDSDYRKAQQILGYSASCLAALQNYVNHVGQNTDEWLADHPAEADKYYKQAMDAANKL